MGGILDHADLAAEQPLRILPRQNRITLHQKAGRQEKIGPGEIELLPQLRRHGDAGHHRFALPCLQRRDQLSIGHCLDLAANLQTKFGAERPRKIDVETGQTAALIGEIEGRKVRRCQEAQAQHAAHIGPHQPFARIEEDREVRILGPRRRRRDRNQHQKGENRGPQPH